MSPVTLYVFIIATVLLTGHCGGDSVSQTPAAVTVTEGDVVQLLCNYTATSTSNPDLFWYRQHSNGSMEFLLRRDRYNTEASTGDRYSAKLNETTRTVPLQVSETELTDSGVYYCALRPLNFADKLLFGSGSKLQVLPKEGYLEPSIFILPPRESDSKALPVCLVTDYFPNNVSVSVSGGQPADTGHHGESSLSLTDKKYSTVAFLSPSQSTQDGVFNCTANRKFKTLSEADKIKLKCIDVKEDEEGDEHVNLLSLTTFCLRVLFLKSIVFNVLMTIRVWVS